MLDPAPVNVRVKLAGLWIARVVLPPRIGRIANLVLAVGYAITIVAGAIGEWTYYLLGSALEILLLAALAYYAWTWPKPVPHPG
ncbi:hypothetical protein ACIBL3_23425 [Kribbella sp. NPDC050124]|uniref:hypothetical protein n=1 Tax=Kribbella sp. NPDC050124 TaxID=3364114 RepID=UPI003799159C